MADPVKRLHYFNGQFLRASDFTTEQEYHLQMRRSHNRLLHTVGIADGLKVEIQPGGAAITVRPGIAYDGQGREIVLAEEQDIDLPAGALYVTIAYSESQSDPTDETGSTGDTRWTEEPQIELTTNAPADPNQKLVLGRIVEGDTQKSVDESERRLAGVKGGDLAVRSLTLTDPSIGQTGPRFTITATTIASLTGSLTITDSITVQRNLVVGGNGSVSGTLTIANDATVQRNLTVTRNGTINGALSVAGDVTAQRNLTVSGNSTITGTLSVTGDVTTQGALSVTRDVKIGGEASIGRNINVGGLGVFTGNVGVGTATPENSESWEKVLDILGANHAKLSVRSSAIDARIMVHNGGFWQAPAGMILGTRTAHPVSVGTSGAARMTVAANGEVTINGRLNVLGGLNVQGGKNGYVTDRFVNNLGEALEEGDVVVIGENQATLYYGMHNNIPILEVDLAQRICDPRVCGIVAEVHATLEVMGDDSSATPTKGKRTRKTKTQLSTETHHLRDLALEELAELDRTKVAPGQIGGMVTLGAFAHCKVDADIAPIQVGDLLTTSPTKGHAQKVLDPSQAVGAILGKALGALAKGKGKIPVLVMLQ